MRIKTQGRMMTDTPNTWSKPLSFIFFGKNIKKNSKMFFIPREAGNIDLGQVGLSVCLFFNVVACSYGHEVFSACQGRNRWIQQRTPAERRLSIERSSLTWWLLTWWLPRQNLGLEELLWRHRERLLVGLKAILANCPIPTGKGIVFPEYYSQVWKGRVRDQVLQVHGLLADG